MKTVSVIDHSGYGHTTSQAEAIVSGVNSIEHVQANLIAIDQICVWYPCASLFLPRRNRSAAFEEWKDSPQKRRLRRGAKAPRTQADLDQPWESVSVGARLGRPSK